MGQTLASTNKARHLFLVTALLAAVVAYAPAPAASAALTEEGFEACLLDKINTSRANVGRHDLVMAFDLNPQVRAWSEWMAVNSNFRHMNSSERAPILPDDWNAWGENIAWWSNPNLADCAQIHNMLMNSPGHRANILDEDFDYAALGAHVDSSGWWVTELFFASPGYNAVCDGTFCDDDSSPFEGSIEAIAGAGITNGCNPPANYNFCPDGTVTRGEMAAFVSRALNLPDGESTDFIDDNGSVYESAIEKIAAAGITNGCNPPTNNRFCPNERVSRGQMAAFLARALDLSTPGSSANFIDVGNSIYIDAIEKVAAAGITVGCNPPSNTRFCPTDYVTRGQMAAFLTRALEL